ncbi:E3 ubiquitin-protein ligase makorin isoform X2 [Phalaenopsis equestris]|uniref:E3 ubiquitin-protein ligase makorin isoform X2 n=1 Tax=Phalaenopsis equestris TaxID=78828 RepID=UPI0009E252CD|nr:E3 ubiquitin-protein ligase makorin isoform X2 [Phalaenopsis equestris]
MKLKASYSEVRIALGVRRRHPTMADLQRKRVLCKYFVHGACFKGEYCEFSHDWKDQSNNACTFYQKGLCSFGSRCRYDHVKVSNARPSMGTGSLQAIQPYNFSLNGEHKPSSSSFIEFSDQGKHIFPSSKPAWNQSHRLSTFEDYPIGHDPAYNSIADQPICSFAAAGSCPHGEGCPHIHGDQCSICKKYCLHPYRPDEREEHVKLCQKNNQNLEALRFSQEIECSVCLDRVLSERKFGLLSECDHPFCISCIRNWRSNCPSIGMDVNSTLRACPMCRKLSYFVIPSVIWYSTSEEKQEIVENYKAKLKTIDCKYFDFGNGTCPFGTSCFYKGYKGIEQSQAGLCST